MNNDMLEKEFLDVVLKDVLDKFGEIITPTIHSTSLSPDKNRLAVSYYYRYDSYDGLEVRADYLVGLLTRMPDNKIVFEYAIPTKWMIVEFKWFDDRVEAREVPIAMEGYHDGKIYTLPFRE